MGNHSETGELLEEARKAAITEGSSSVTDKLIDDIGHTIKLDRSPEELTDSLQKSKLLNPTKLKSREGKDVINMMKAGDPNEEQIAIMLEQAKKYKQNEIRKNHPSPLISAIYLLGTTTSN